MSIVLIRLIGVGLCLIAVAIMVAAIVYGVRGDRLQLASVGGEPNAQPDQHGAGEAL